MNGFRSVRWMRTINLVAQAVLVVTLCAGLNYLAFNHSWRWDLTARNRFSLSAETRAYLRNLERPVRVVVTLTENSEVPQVAAALPEIRGLLREYVYATESNVDPGRRDGRIAVEYIDIYARNREAAQAGVTEPNAITFICGERSRVVLLQDLYKFTDRGELTAFLGEQVFTTAIIDVAKSQKKIYFLTGHGEARIDDPLPEGVSLLAENLRRRNFAVENLNIDATRGVPDDAAIIIAIRPQLIGAFEQEQLRQYLGSTAQNGRLILFLEPGRAAGLDKLLEDWGVYVFDDIVYDPDPKAITNDGHMLVLALAENHLITQALVANRNLFPHIGRSRSMRTDVGGQKLSGVKATPIAATSKSAWGEISYRTEMRPQYTAGVDVKGHPALEPSERLGLIFASERIQPKENLPRFSVANGRLVVFGSPDYATNQWYSVFQGNQSLILNAVAWAGGRDEWLNIPPRPIERFQLSLSERDLVRLRYSLLLFLPGLAAVLGVFVYWTRRT